MELKRGNVNEEKHVPFIEEIDGGYRVTIGKPGLHPMTDAHLIEYVELYVDDKLAGTKDFTSNDTPIVEFQVPKGKDVYAIEHCNLHGTWINSL